MTTLSDFPITRRWPPARPGAIQFYTATTPNGRKIGVALEEMGLDYEVHKLSLAEDETHTPEFLSLNPNNKIPAIIDPDGPDGAPIGMFESGAILIYLAEKTGRFLPPEPRKRYEVIQWLMWQMGGPGPFFGQIGYFKLFAGKAIEDPRPLQRFMDEAARLLDVLEEALEERDWIAGDFSIADMAIAPWLAALEKYGVREDLDWDDHDRVTAYFDRFMARPAVQRGMRFGVGD